MLIVDVSGRGYSVRLKCYEIRQCDSWRDAMTDEGQSLIEWIDDAEVGDAIRLTDDAVVITCIDEWKEVAL